MKTTIYKNTLEVDGQGETFYTESAWWHALKKHLNERGHDLVKKTLSRDWPAMGNNTRPYYLRDRRDRYCFYDGEYTIRMVNQQEIVTLCISGEPTP